MDRPATQHLRLAAGETLPHFLKHLPLLERKFPGRVPGTAIFMTSHPETVPTALMHNLKHNKVLHEHNVILTIETAQTPRVDLADRVRMETISDKFATVRLPSTEMRRVPIDCRATVGSFGFPGVLRCRACRKDVGLMLGAAGNQPLVVLPALAARMDEVIAAGRGKDDLKLAAPTLGGIRSLHVYYTVACVALVLGGLVENLYLNVACLRRSGNTFG